MQPKNEYGYVIIDTEEKRRVFYPFLNDDEIFIHGVGFRPIFNHGTKFIDGTIYRRRIWAGEGFEIVPENAETSSYELAKWDYTKDGLSWNSCNSEYAATGILAYRRLKQSLPAPVEQSPWRPIGDLTGLPETGKVLISDANGYDLDLTGVLNVKTGNVASYITQWCPHAPVPKPPKPMTEEEALKALLSPDDNREFDAGVREGWNARKSFDEQSAKSK